MPSPFLEHDMTLTLTEKVSGGRMETLELPDEVEVDILNLIKNRRTVPLEAVSHRLDEVRHILSLGYLALIVIAYPWGADFELGLSKKGIDYLFEEQSRTSRSGVLPS